MTHASLSIIRHEHRALSAMLRSITLLLGEHRRRGTLPDFGALRAMLFYVDEFPEKLHHPKETQLLFPKLRGLDANVDSVLDRLDHDHSCGEHAVRELEHALIAFEMMADTDQRESRREVFETAVQKYVAFYLEHMHVEETVVLPLAESALGAADWAELDAAFRTNRDPLTGHEADESYRPLFRKILRLLPGSNSIGSALEALAGTALPKYREPS
ncbi:MAG: hemerythrin domain-containing protein [Burkholderiales bacterium]